MERGRHRRWWRLWQWDLTCGGGGGRGGGGQEEKRNVRRGLTWGSFREPKEPDVRIGFSCLLVKVRFRQEDLVVQGGECGVCCPNDFLFAGVLDGVEVSVTHVVVTHVLLKRMRRIKADVKTILRVFAEELKVHSTRGRIEFGLHVEDMRNEVGGETGLLYMRIWMEDDVWSFYRNFLFAKLVYLVFVLYLLKQGLIAENSCGIQGDIAWIGGRRRGRIGRGGNCRQEGRSSICGVR